jgi:16S rRNA (cytidine1402-2'-O)-methyltransferase
MLYLVATPIGNLEDITLRALRVLREADLIACEDTRQTGKLLAHFSIDKPTVSYHEHNEAARTRELMAKLQGGASIALVSDAGTPLVSDPGYRLVTAAIGAGITVVPLPGASAVLGALAAAGLPTEAFRFCGFLPAKQGQRKKALEALRGEDCTMIFYEGPHRILDTLADVAAVFGDRPVVIARELTKIHEGEITLLIGKGLAALPDTPIDLAVQELEKKGVPRMDAIKQVARERGLSKREVYKQIT